ncbi:RsmB/NOP family class I SAM-dependent RNA methyltransferase [Sphingomonas aestuarii]
MSISPNRPRLAPEAPGVPARRAALRLIDAVLRRGQALEQALDGAAKDLELREDRALAHALAAAVLRRTADLDTLIDSATRMKLADDAKARTVLRMALAQVLDMGTPPHAAISTVLPLVDGGPRKLVHGVFGTLMRGEVTLPESVALPPAVSHRWRGYWGNQVVRDAGQAIAAPPPLDLALADPSRTEEWATKLEGVSLMPGHVRLPAGAAVPFLDGFDEGAWWVQDLAASLPARLLGKGGGRVLDLCAAPGGKTMQLAAAGWDVTAVDASESRLARLSENLARTNLTAQVVAADLRNRNWQPEGEADAVLLDAPCSATGIFRRHPDVLHRAHGRLIAEMAELQGQLLHRSAKWVRPGGTLVFATCSLEPVEGEEQVRTFLNSRPDFAIQPVSGDELPVGVTPQSEGWVRTLPGMLADVGGLDGFFMVRLRRQD